MHLFHSCFKKDIAFRFFQRINFYPSVISTKFCSTIKLKQRSLALLSERREALNEFLSNFQRSFFTFPSIFSLFPKPSVSRVPRKDRGNRSQESLDLFFRFRNCSRARIWFCSITVAWRRSCFILCPQDRPEFILFLSFAEKVHGATKAEETRRTWQTSV